MRLERCHLTCPEMARWMLETSTCQTGPGCDVNVRGCNAVAPEDAHKRPAGPFGYHNADTGRLQLHWTRQPR
jgi:hypothetical protein